MVPPLRGESFPSATDLAPNSPPLPPYKAPGSPHVASDQRRLGRKLQHHPHRAVLPSHYKIPSFFHPLLDGENGPSPESPIPFQATSNTRPSSSHSYRLIPPCLLDRQSPPKVQAAVSSLVSALAFLDVFQSASDTGKARLLDGSTQHGPSAWLVRISKAERFRYFEQGTDQISARAADLLACPPHLLDKTIYRAPSNQVSTVYLSEPMDVTLCTAVKGSVCMVLSAIRFVMSSASFSNVAGFARLLSVLYRIGR
jgi:hypothetical protein